MGMQFLRKEFWLLCRIQLGMAVLFAIVSAILLVVGAGASYPFRLLWLVGGICLAADAIITVTMHRKWEKTARTNRRRHEES